MLTSHPVHRKPHKQFDTMIDTMNTAENETQPSDPPAPAASDTAPTPIAASTPTIESLQKQLDAANAELAVFRSGKEALDAESVLIQEKMRVGLTESQARAVVRRQRTHEESDYGKSLRARRNASQGIPARA